MILASERNHRLLGSQLERRRNELLAKAHQLRELKKQQASLQEQRDELLARRSELLDERFEVCQSVAARIDENLGPAIRVTIRQCSTPHRYVRLLEETLRRARIRHLQVAQKLCRGFWPAELAAAIRSCDTRGLWTSPRTTWTTGSSSRRSSTASAR